MKLYLAAVSIVAIGSLSACASAAGVTNHAASSAPVSLSDMMTTSPASSAAASSVPSPTPSATTRTTLAGTTSVDVLISRTTQQASDRVPPVHRVVTGAAASTVAAVADSLPVLAKPPQCAGFSAVNLHDTFVFRDAANQTLGTITIAGCPEPTAVLQTAQGDVQFSRAIELDAAGLTALGLPTSYGLTTT